MKYFVPSELFTASTTSATYSGNNIRVFNQCPTNNATLTYQQYNPDLDAITSVGQTTFSANTDYVTNCSSTLASGRKVTFTTTVLDIPNRDVWRPYLYNSAIIAFVLIVFFAYKLIIHPFWRKP